MASLVFTPMAFVAYWAVGVSGAAIWTRCGLETAGRSLEVLGASLSRRGV